MCRILSLTIQFILVGTEIVPSSKTTDPKYTFTHRGFENLFLSLKIIFQLESNSIMIQSLCDNFAFFKMLKKASCLLKQIHGLMKLTWTLKNRFVKYVSISLGPVRNDLVITRNFRYIHRVWCSSYRKLGLVSYSSVQQISARSFGKKWNHY